MQEGGRWALVVRAHGRAACYLYAERREAHRQEAHVLQRHAARAGSPLTVAVRPATPADADAPLDCASLGCRDVEALLRDGAPRA